MKYNLNFITDYGQFYVADKNSEGDTANESFWSNQAFADKLAVEKGILGVSIANEEGVVKVEIEILEFKSTISDFNNFDHVVEASIEIKSGILQIVDCPFTQVELETQIEVGTYRVRVYSKNLLSAYDENPNDSYKIEIWKENYLERNVLKRFLG